MFGLKLHITLLRVAVFTGFLSQNFNMLTLSHKAGNVFSNDFFSFVK